MKRSHQLLLYVLFLTLELILIGGAVGNQVEISLNGDSWSLSDTDGRVKAVKSQVPGSVHLDLMRQGIIGDPYDGFNDDDFQWIAFDNWTYSRSFAMTTAQIEGKTVWLKCEGLDTVATVSVNNQDVGYASNMHRQYLFDITGVVKAGNNEIKVEFESAANYSIRMQKDYPYTVHGNTKYISNAARNFVRKAQSDFGWDWGPAFVPAGIWQNISIVTFSDAYVSYVIPKTFYDNFTKSYYLSLTTCLNIPKPTSLNVSIQTLFSHTTIPAINKNISVESTVDDVSECHTLQSDPLAAAVIEGEHLWWPAGTKWPTSPPNLLMTKTTVTLEKNGRTLSNISVAKNVGFRNIELIQDPVGDDGLTFYFQLSTSTEKYPIYSKGSNFIPMDAFVTRPTPEYTRRLLQSALDGNQNMIRIWGGGLYQPDWFYDLCDEMGIMVWQEFMFADALYPRDLDFLANVEEEVRHVVRRLGNHPSIVLWSGNNENQDIAYYGGTASIVDYSVLYDDTVRATLWQEDNSRIYWPASPSNGFLVDDQERGLFIQKWGEAKDPNVGDLHRYDYTDYCTDVTKFPRPRFASEFGFQAYPSFRSLQNISKSDDWSNDSPLMLHRQHHPNGNQQMEAQMAMFFHLPNNTEKADQFMDFVYLSQVIQAICIDAEAQHYRRLLSEEGTYTRGTLYWQLNDIWQAPTWASVEWSGQWKLLHYFMRRTYEHVLVSPYFLGGSISIYVVVDVANYDISYNLKVDVISWEKGEIVKSFTESNLTATGFTGTNIWSESVDYIFNGTSKTEAFLYMAVLTNDSSNTLLAENWFFPSNFTDVDLPEAQITTANFTQQTSGQIMFQLKSSTVAPFVYLTSSNYDGVFSENGFLAMPQKVYSITFDPLASSSSDHEEMDLSTFKEGLSVRTVSDTYSNKSY